MVIVCFVLYVVYCTEEEGSRCDLVCGSDSNCSGKGSQDGGVRSEVDLVG
jgi:hypothetical protein